jgi:hypothetical protein
VAKALQYATRGYRMTPASELGQALFAEEAVALGVQQLGNVVLVRDIEFYSTHQVRCPAAPPPLPPHTHAHAPHPTRACRCFARGGRYR